MREKDNSDYKIQSLLQELKIIHPRRKCQKSLGNQVTHICINPSCQNSALICQLQSCRQCSGNHLQCRLVNFKCVSHYLKNKADSQRSFLLNLLQRLQEFITQIQKRTTQLIQGFYLTDLQINYFNIVEALYIKQQENYQIKGALAKEFLELLQKTSHEALQNKPKMIQKIRDQLSKISISLNDLQTRMIEQFTKQRLKRQLTILENSKIVPLENQQQRRLIDEALNKPKRLQLLFRASENAFEASKFHLACNNIPNTFTLIRSQFGKTFGGFTPLTWNSAPNAYSKDQNFKSFLISLDLKQKMSLVNSAAAIKCTQNYGPTFGSGHDVYISNKCNQNSNSYAKFPYSYNGGKVYQQNQSAYSAFCGAGNGTNFKVTQYQVYKVIWE